MADQADQLKLWLLKQLSNIRQEVRKKLLLRQQSNSTLNTVVLQAVTEHKCTINYSAVLMGLGWAIFLD